MEKINNEYWYDINGYEGLYQVSSLQRIKSLSRMVTCKNGIVKRIKERILKKNYDGEYLRVSLYRDGQLYCVCVHRIICEIRCSR